MKGRNFNFILIGLLMILLESCGPKIVANISKSLPVTAYDQEIIVVKSGQSIPAGFMKIGDVYAGESGFTMKCNYDYMMQRINEECRKMGGSLICITEHKTPDLWSSCHRIRADVYVKQEL